MNQWVSCFFRGGKLRSREGNWFIWVGGHQLSICPCNSLQLVAHKTEPNFCPGIPLVSFQKTGKYRNPDAWQIHAELGTSLVSRKRYLLSTFRTTLDMKKDLRKRSRGQSMGVDVFQRGMVSKPLCVIPCHSFDLEPQHLAANLLKLVEDVTRNLCRSENILKFQTGELLMNLV